VIHEKVVFFRLSSLHLGDLIPPLLSSKDGTKACEERRKPQNESALLHRNSCGDVEAERGGSTMPWVGIAHERKWRGRSY